MRAAPAAAFGRAQVPPPAEAGFGHAVPCAPRLRLVAALPDPAPPPRSLRDHPHPLARRWDALCRRVEQRLAAHHLSRPDLAEGIGSPRWYRELAAFGTLSVLALACWPSFAPLEAAPLATPDERARREVGALSLSPWADGAQQGRHFAATGGVVRLDSAPERPTIRLAATLGERDTLPQMLRRAGVAPADADRTAALMQQAVPLATLAPGTRFDLTLGARSAPVGPRPLALLAVRPRFDLALTIARDGGALSLSRRPIAVTTQPLRLTGLVGSSLYRALRNAGATPDTAQDYLRAIDQAMPFDALTPADRFDLVVQFRRAADGQGEPGPLLYAAIDRGGAPQAQLLRWGSDGAFRSLADISGEAMPQSALLGAPVAGHITSGYGLRRHPILGYTRMHAGIDFGAAWGAPIYAVSDGRVAYAGWHGGHGNYVRLEHGGGIGTGYGHMSRLAVAPGMAVRRGQVIGYVGSTGLSTGPHLHYELYRGGQTVDPMSVRFLVQRQAADPGQIAAFKARLRAMLAVRPQSLARSAAGGA